MNSVESRQKEPAVHILANGKSSPWVRCKKCEAETYYNPTCGNCDRDLLVDFIEDLVSADAAACFDHTARLSDLMFKNGIPTPTKDLGPVAYTPPATLAEMVNGGGPSVAGWSISSAALECPYRGQLMASRVKPVGQWQAQEELNALGYGSLIHALLAVRWVHGVEWAFKLLEMYAAEIHPLDKIKAETALHTYNDRWPRESEPFYVLGIESEVFTEIGPGVVVSVRYDSVVKPFKVDQSGNVVIGANGYPEAEDYVLSLERKTSARGGESTMASYTGQFYTQVANWNLNLALVEKYGPMKGVIGDIVTKTKVPSADRIGPRYITKAQQQFAIDYHRLKHDVRWPIDEHGRLPRMLHACIGRYGPCQFYSLCHDDAQNNFTADEVEE